MTLRLASMAREHWRDVNGYALSCGLRGDDLLDMEVDDFTSFVWFWATRNADKEGLEKFKTTLWQPPAGEEGEGVWSAESETAAFNQLASALGKKRVNASPKKRTVIPAAGSQSGAQV